MSSISKKVSPLVKTQLPDFIREDAPLFQKFVEGYYEFLEQGNNVIEVTRSLQSYQDIDTSVDKYIEYIKRELLPSFPKTLTADQKLLVKRAKDFYRSRGSEKSYQLLFRALYNEDITIYDPGDSILRASDGRWIQENSIRVGDPVVGNTELLLGQNITGISSGATFAAALEAAQDAPEGSNILAMLPDTGERYLSTFLFDGIDEGSDEEILASLND